MTRLPEQFIRYTAAAVAGALALTACLSSGPVEPQFRNPAAGKAIVFIGNSLTYSNELPMIVQALADAGGGDSLIIAMYAGPNLALIDHWHDGGASDKIASRQWDFVVLQQGPSSTALNRDTLRLATGLFAPGITAAGARAVLFAAWPTINRRQDFERASESYRLAAQDVGGLYAPVAAAWLKAWEKDATLQLYSNDGLHPSLLGSYLSALVIYARIMDRSPVGLPASLNLRAGGTLSIPPALATLLQEAAWEAVTAAVSS